MSEKLHKEIKKVERKERTVIKLKDWQAQGEKLFGPHGRDWKFKCVQCGTVQCGRDFVEAGLTPAETMGYVGFSCIGREKQGVGCDWTLGGLFTIHTLEIETEDGRRHPRFEFAIPEEEG